MLHEQCLILFCSDWRGRTPFVYSILHLKVCPVSFPWNLSYRLLKKSRPFQLDYLWVWFEASPSALYFLRALLFEKDRHKLQLVTLRSEKWKVMEKSSKDERWNKRDRRRQRGRERRRVELYGHQSQRITAQGNLTAIRTKHVRKKVSSL